MKTLEISVPGAGRFVRLLPDVATAQAWAQARFPNAQPASVICLRGGGQ